MTMVIPAIREPASIAPFFKALAQTTVPARVDSNFMAGIGFRRQSDVRLLELLHHLGFMDSSFQPTEVWKRYFSAPDEDAKLAILGRAVAESYSEALSKGGNDGSSRLNGRAVMTHFREKTGASETETAYMVLTLQILLDLTGLPDRSPEPQQSNGKTGPSHDPGSEKPLTVTLNITLDPEADPELALLLRKLLERHLEA